MSGSGPTIGPVSNSGPNSEVQQPILSLLFNDTYFLPVATESDICGLTTAAMKQRFKATLFVVLDGCTAIGREPMKKPPPMHLGSLSAWSHRTLFFFIERINGR